VNRVVGFVNGVEIARAGTCDTAGLGWPYAGKLSPCAGSAAFDLTQNTAGSPFHNGENTVQIQPVDFTGNRGPTVTRTVHVDNAVPELAFANAQDPDDPELIRAPVWDPHSGVAGGKLALRSVGGSDWQPLDTQVVDGELRARVDSSAMPPGDYEFRAEAADVAGNVAETTRREDGEPMVLEFPLRLGVELQAHLEPGGSHQQTIPYRRDSHVAGRLLDRGGDPLADKRITVVEHFGDGALIRERVSHVRTDGDGRWDSKLPAGPSRRVTAHFGGNERYLPAGQEAGSLKVRSRASFRTSRKRVPEGGRVKFKGKVGHFGARIPVGGKLIELQVRESAGRWQTVREAFYTKPSGRYRLKYRFGRFYQSDARFRFRVKIARESDWPYKAPARSRQRRVTVLAR
jgi:5-hydroxyisourate hydrolase-like protein (transthyretin family)